MLRCLLCSDGKSCKGAISLAFAIPALVGDIEWHIPNTVYLNERWVSNIIQWCFTHTHQCTTHKSGVRLPKRFKSWKIELIGSHIKCFDCASRGVMFVRCRTGKLNPYHCETSPFTFDRATILSLGEEGCKMFLILSGLILRRQQNIVTVILLPSSDTPPAS